MRVRAQTSGRASIRWNGVAGKLRNISERLESMKIISVFDRTFHNIYVRTAAMRPICFLFHSGQMLPFVDFRVVCLCVVTGLMRLHNASKQTIDVWWTTVQPVSPYPVCFFFCVILGGSWPHSPAISVRLWLPIMRISAEFDNSQTWWIDAESGGAFSQRELRNAFHIHFHLHRQIQRGRTNN